MDMESNLRSSVRLVSIRGWSSCVYSFARDKDFGCRNLPNLQLFLCAGFPSFAMADQLPYLARPDSNAQPRSVNSVARCLDIAQSSIEFVMVSPL